MLEYVLLTRSACEIGAMTAEPLSGSGDESRAQFGDQDLAVVIEGGCRMAERVYQGLQRIGFDRAEQRG